MKSIVGGISGLVITLLFGAMLGGLGGWKVQAWRHAEQDRQRAEQTLKETQKARAEEVARTRNAERINDEQAKRLALTTARAAAAGRAAAGLRDEIRRLNARPVPDSPELAAAAREARAARDLLGECSDRYRAVDERAQSLGDQVTGLQAFAVDVCKAGQ